MKIGRPVEFDRIAALEKSMVLFWRNGYEATSLTDLIQEMGIGRQSLYNTFGDKHSLFVEAVEHYISQNSQQLIDVLQAPGSPVGNIRRVLEQIVDFAVEGKCRGCLVTNSIVERAPRDEKVGEIVRSMICRLETALRDALERAVELGEIPTDSDTKALASFLNTTVHGMVVLGKASAKREDLEGVVKVALSTLR